MMFHAPPCGWRQAMHHKRGERAMHLSSCVVSLLLILQGSTSLVSAASAKHRLRQRKYEENLGASLQYTITYVSSFKDKEESFWSRLMQQTDMSIAQSVSPTPLTATPVPPTPAPAEPTPSPTAAPFGPLPTDAPPTGSPPTVPPPTVAPPTSSPPTPVPIATAEPTPAPLSTPAPPTPVPIATAEPTPAPLSTPAPPTPQPTISVEQQNEIVTCISVIDESTTIGGRPREFNDEWQSLRQQFPERPFCLLQPQRPNGTPTKEALGIPEAFEDDNITNHTNVSRGDADESSPSNWYLECNLQEQRDMDITWVAFFIDTSPSLGGLNQVRTSFNSFHQTLKENGFRVARGIFNSNEDWVSPCESAFVLDNQTSITCTRNRDCLSNVCVLGVCQNGFQSIGEACDENDDCQNFACGYRGSYNISLPPEKVCCPSNPTIRDICSNQPAGATCLTLRGESVDEVCESNVCVQGICQSGPRAIGEPCDPDDDEDCANGACGHEIFQSTSPFICCPSNNTIRGGGDNYCTGQPAGATCLTEDGGSRDSVCESNVCVQGICQSGPRAIGEPCDPDDDEDCANGACGHEIFQSSSPFICCPSNNTVRGGGDNYCTGQPAGATCLTEDEGSRDSVCESNVCVQGICQSGLRAIGEPCDPDDDEDCSNGACGREIFRPTSPFICCPSNNTVREGGDNYCAGQPTGAVCDTANDFWFDSVCESNVCVNGVCQ